MLVGIVLAAGASRRLGQPKQLLPLGQTTVLGQTLAIATYALERVAVVLGAHAEAIRTQVDLLGAEVILNPDYAQGQATSLLAGLRVVADWPEAEAALVLLGDQPTVQPEAIQAVIAAYRAANPATPLATVVPCYGDRPGNPVLFARTAWPQLLAELHGDQGARHLLARGEPAPLVQVALPAAWWPPDIDTWEDYQALLAR